MRHSFIPAIAALASAVSAGQTGSASATPHDSYSSSIGVLGCKVNTDRIAYWPMSPDCDNICVQVSSGGRSVNLLRVDQSGGAYDISYDAWNYLYTGKSATVAPAAGGGIPIDYEFVDASQCADLIYTSGKAIPLSAANSMNFLASCLAQPSSYIAKKHLLYNIQDSLCSLGNDEICTLNLAVSNQPSCPHMLGIQTPLTSAPVYNIKYPSGKKVLATMMGETVVSSDAATVPVSINHVVLTFLGGVLSVMVAMI
jgi:hypothetical protein